MIEFAPHMPPLANDSYHKHFKYMARARISEFESSYPSQGVVSSQRLRRDRDRILRQLQAVGAPASAVTRARLVGCDLKCWSSLSSFLESYGRKLVTE
jgi:hypothetical protein